MNKVERLEFGEYSVVEFGGAMDPIEAFENVLHELAFDVLGAYLRTLSVYGKRQRE